MKIDNVTSQPYDPRFDDLRRDTDNLRLELVRRIEALEEKLLALADHSGVTFTRVPSHIEVVRVKL